MLKCAGMVSHYPSKIAARPNERFVTENRR